MDTTEDQSAAVIDAIEAALRPLMPLFRNFGVTHHELAQMLARLFVYDTAEILQKEGRPTTTGRLALMTGLTRAETERHLADRRVAVHRRSQKASALMTPAAVLTAWNTDGRFSTPYGVALDLSLNSSGRQRTFDDLVMANRAYIPAGVSVERITRMGTALGSLAATLTRNLLEEAQAVYVERAVQTDFPVSSEGRRAIREWLLVDGTRFLETLDAWMTSSKTDLEASSGQRVGVEFFMYDAPAEASASTDVQLAANQ